MNWFTSFKKSKALAFVAGLALASAAGALAFVVINGLTGSSSGNFTSNSSTQSALIVSANGPVGDLDAGGAVAMPIKVTNSDGSGHILSANAAASFSSTPTDCASHLSVGGYSDPATGNPSSALSAGASYTGNQVRDVQVIINADPSTPSDCVGGHYTVSWTATTS